jgi:hypothetical protein
MPCTVAPISPDQRVRGRPPDSMPPRPDPGVGARAQRGHPAVPGTSSRPSGPRYSDASGRVSTPGERREAVPGPGDRGRDRKSLRRAVPDRFSCRAVAAVSWRCRELC